MENLKSWSFIPILQSVTSCFLSYIGENPLCPSSSSRTDWLNINRIQLYSQTPCHAWHGPSWMTWAGRIEDALMNHVQTLMPGQSSYDCCMTGSAGWTVHQRGDCTRMKHKACRKVIGLLCSINGHQQCQSSHWETVTVQHTTKMKSAAIRLDT